MAYIGMRNPKFWPCTGTHTDGTPLHYSNPVNIGPAVSANINFEVADNPDYGNDVIIDNDKGVNGYTVTLETNYILMEARAACLGWEPVANGTGPVEYYQVTDSEPPKGGLSFIRVLMMNGARKYEAFFFHQLQFSDGAENASTKEKQIAWNHPTMEGSGIGVYIDSSGKAKYFAWMQFNTQADAETWINTMGGYTPPSP